MAKDGSIVIKTMDLIYEDFDNSKGEKTRRSNKIIFALFIAYVCRENPRRCKKYEKNYKQEGKYKSLPKRISGPCYELFKLIPLHSNEDLSKMIDADKFEFLYNEICKEYISFNQETKSSDNYTKLYDLLRSTNLKETGLDSVVIPDNLVKESYDDLRYRILSYNKDNNYHTKKRVKDETYIELTIGKSTSEDIIDKMNKAYDKLTVKDEETRRKLESFLLPVYSRSPFVSICITHKNNLPKRIRYSKKLNETNYVYAIAVISYDLDYSNVGNNHIMSHNIFSNDYFARIDRNALAAKDIEVNYYYDSAKNVIVDNYQNMENNYKELCQEIIDSDDFFNWTYENVWFPLILPENQFKQLSSAFKKTPVISIENMIVNAESITIEPEGNECSSTQEYMSMSGF